jgi:hypothetical protein
VTSGADGGAPERRRKPHSKQQKRRRRVSLSMLRGLAMRIDKTAFGSITIDGRTYDHDVVIDLSGAVTKRKKRLSKEKYGTSHIISKAEAKAIFEKGCDLVVIGAGQDGNVRLSDDAATYFNKHGCEVLLRRTPEAIDAFNRSHAHKIALMHVTC